MNWDSILKNSVGRNAMVQFALGELSCENVQKVFRAGKDRSTSGEVRNLIRTRGTKRARQVTRSALKRRNLI